MSNPVRIVVGEGESAEIVVGENGSAEVEVPGYGIIAGRDGSPGPAGDDGESAYQIAVDNGFVGTEEEWLASLVGPPGPQGEAGVDGTVSFDELTPEQRESLRGEKGEDGDTGPAGQDGVSPTVAFTSITGGNRMTVTDKDHPSGQSVDIMNGTNGQDGVSPAVTFTAITGGNKMTVTDKAHPSGQSINIMNGTQGATGPAGPGLPTGGAIGQIPVKKSATDYDVEWKSPLDGIQNVTVAGEDLDNYTTGGYRYFSTSYPPINKPADTNPAGFLFVVKGSNNARLEQVWVDVLDNAIYTRSNTTSAISWSEWKRLATDADISLLAKKADFATQLITPVVLETLPTGISEVHAYCVRSGNVVNVNLWVVRDDTEITAFQNIASGFPVPKIRPTVGSVGIPLAVIQHVQTGLPLSVSINGSGILRVRNGNASGNYAGSFTYISDDYVT